MMTVAARGTRHNNRFDVVANAFRQKEGLALNRGQSPIY
jgi:hypothetical protein